MNATDPRVRIRRLREVYKFYLVADAAEDILDRSCNILVLNEEITALEKRVARLMKELVRVEQAVHEATEFRDIILEVEESSAPPNN